MIVLTGESHLGAIKRGAPENPTVLYWPLGPGGQVVTPFFDYNAEANSVRITAPNWRKMSYSKDSLTFDGTQALLALSMPLNTSRILRDHDWVTHVPWHLVQSPDEAPLSDAVVAAILEQDYRYSIAFVEALLACGIQVVVIEGPHFFEHARYVKRMRLDVVTYIDTQYRETVIAKLAHLGVDVIRQRSETLTHQNSTKKKFKHESSTDQHHASAKYGTLVYEDLIAYAAKVDA